MNIPGFGAEAVFLKNTADIFFSIFDRLSDIMRRNADSRQTDRQAVADALSVAVNISNRTMRYIAQLRRAGGQHSLQEEAALSQGWTDAGIKLSQLPNPPLDFVERYFLTSEYWSDPESWTDERIDAAMIRLEDLARESRAVLLGRNP